MLLVVAHRAETLATTPGDVDDRHTGKARRQRCLFAARTGHQRQWRQPAPTSAEPHPRPAAEHRDPLPEGVTAESSEAGPRACQSRNGGQEEGHAVGEGGDGEDEPSTDQAALHEAEPQEHTRGVSRVEAVHPLLTLGGHRSLLAWSVVAEQVGSTTVPSAQFRR